MHRSIWEPRYSLEAVADTPTSAVPLRIRRFVQGPGPLTRSLVVRTPPLSDATLFVIQLATEIRRSVRLGRNYVNPQAPWEKLSRRYPFLRKCFAPDSLTDVWTKIPPRRKVPRTRIDLLLEWVRLGGDKSPAGLEFESEWSRGDPINSGYNNEEDVGGSWRRPEPEPIVESVPPIPILPDFERLWDYVERCSRLPALLIIDSIDALASHYGIEPSRLIDAIQQDLVDTGYAHVVYVSEDPDRPSWLYLMDGVLSWIPLRLPGRGPQWILTIEYLAGRESRQRRYVMAFQNGRLITYPSDDEVVAMLERATWRPLVKTIPSEIIDFLAEPGGNTTVLPD